MRTAAALLCSCLLAGANLACAKPPRAVDSPLDADTARDIDALEQLTTPNTASPIHDRSPLGGARFTGGDGTALGRAIVVLDARDVTTAESALITRALGRVTFLATARYAHRGHTFDCVTIERGDGRRSTLWFDVTPASP